MELSTMRTRLRRRIGNPSVTDVPDSTLTEVINIGYREIADRFRFHDVRVRFEFPTVASTRNYELPAGLLSIIRLRDVDNQRRIIKMDDARAAELLDTDTEGQPLHYIRYENTIDLHPTPDDVYDLELYYKGNIVDLVDAADEPVLPEPWHEGILRLAKHYYYIDQGDAQKSTLAYNEYELWLRTKPVEVDEEKTDFDSGVSVPTLSDRVTQRLDFDHSP